MDILQCIYGFKWRRGVFSVKTEGPLMIEARQFQAQLKKISGFLILALSGEKAFADS